MISFFKKSRRKEKDESSEILRVRQQRIDELRCEVLALREEVARLRKREEGIADAISFARSQAKEYSEEAKVRFSLELARLETYRQKWLGYVHDISKAKDLGQEIIKTESLLRQTAKDIENAVSEDLPLKSPAELDYQAESDRISQTQKPDEQDLMEDDELRTLIVQLLDKASETAQTT